MIGKSQSYDLKTSLEAVQQINWLDGVHQLPNDVDQKLLDQCSDIIREFHKEISPRKSRVKRTVQKRQVSKGKKLQRKTTKMKRTAQKFQSKVKRLKKNAHPFDYAHLSSMNNYPGYPSSFPCLRSYGPINCPKNKLPMPRDLWYRIVYSQALEQQLGSGDAVTPRKHTGSSLQSSSKRKHKEDESEMEKSQRSKSNSTNPRQQQTMNAAISSTLNKIVKFDEKADDRMQKPALEWNQENPPTDSHSPFPMDKLPYIAETLPLEVECEYSSSNLMDPKIVSKQNVKPTYWKPNFDKIVLSSQSAHIELLNRPKIYRGISADATLGYNNELNIAFPNESHLSIGDIPTPSAPSASIILHQELNSEAVTSSPIQPRTSNLTVQEIIHKNPDDTSRTHLSVRFDHPLINQLFEYYHLEDIPRLQLFKRLNRRLRHIHQSLKDMSSNDIELKLKYKRDALVKKRQTPVQSLTKDERTAMAELELNVYEYVQALDEPLSKSFHINEQDASQSGQLLSTPPILSFHETDAPLVTSAMLSESSIAPSVSTFDTVQPSTISQSTACLSIVTQFSEKTEQLASWTHPLESTLLNLFEPLSPSHKAKIHKQLARRYEHICNKARELSSTQLQTQIDAKSKALEQSKRLSQPNKAELLRIAELELSLFELRHGNFTFSLLSPSVILEQTQRNSLDD